MGPFKRRVMARLAQIQADVDFSFIHLVGRLEGLRHAIAREQAHLDHTIRAEGDKIMSVLSDKIAVVGTAVDDAATRVQSDVANLKAQIAALQAQIDQGGASQADLDALDALKTKLDQIDPATATTLP